MKSHVENMIFENIENQNLNKKFNSSNDLSIKLKNEKYKENRKDHFTFIFDVHGTTLLGDEKKISTSQIQYLQKNSKNSPAIISLKDNNIELLGLLVPLTDGGMYFNAYNVKPMNQQTQVISLMTGVGLLVIQLMILLISLRFSRHNLYRVNHIIDTLEQYARGQHKVRVNSNDNKDEFDQLSQEINMVLGRTQTLMEEVRTITSHVAHELKTPLTRLQHKLINVSESLTGKELAELEKAIDETEQIQLLFRSIMRLSEVETGQISHQKNKINAYDIVYEAYEYYQPLAESYDIDLKLSASKKHYFYADKVLIFQAITNLLDNAIKYAPESKTLTLTIYSSLGNTFIKVTDQGKGIPEESLQFVTQRFKRLSSKKDVFGHGLGLTLIRAIVSLHNGELILTNTHPGLCACIKIRSAKATL
ncbi:MAG: ATP-binding protein [Marinomonas foliarum]|uniref:sensor histidine kinase n=1 Tax=Marinomonas foliarum TaxID=491950 RepID=UPI003F96A9AF